MVLVYYKPRFRRPFAWVKLEYIVRIPRKHVAGSEEYYCSWELRDGVLKNSAFPFTRDHFVREEKEDVHWRHWYPLSQEVAFDLKKALWLSPEGSIVYASRSRPEADSFAVHLGVVPDFFKDGFKVDAREARRRMETFGVKTKSASALDRVQQDISAICAALPFLQEYGHDLAVISEEVEQAMGALPKKYRAIVQMRLGEYPGSRSQTWRVVAKTFNRSATRCHQIWRRALKLLRTRLLRDRFRRRFILRQQKGS